MSKENQIHQLSQTEIEAINKINIKLDGELLTEEQKKKIDYFSKNPVFNKKNLFKYKTPEGFNRKKLKYRTLGALINTLRLRVATTLQTDISIKEGKFQVPKFKDFNIAYQAKSFHEDKRTYFTLGEAPTLHNENRLHFQLAGSFEEFNIETNTMTTPSHIRTQHKKKQKNKNEKREAIRTINIKGLKYNNEHELKFCNKTENKKSPQEQATLFRQYHLKAKAIHQDKNKEGIFVLKTAYFPGSLNAKQYLNKQFTKIEKYKTKIEDHKPNAPEFRKLFNVYSAVFYEFYRLYTQMCLHNHFFDLKNGQPIFSFTLRKTTEENKPLKSDFQDFSRAKTNRNEITDLATKANLLLLVKLGLALFFQKKIHTALGNTTITSENVETIAKKFNTKNLKAFKYPLEEKFSKNLTALIRKLLKYVSKQDTIDSEDLKTIEKRFANITVTEEESQAKSKILEKIDTRINGITEKKNILGPETKIKSTSGAFWRSSRKPQKLKFCKKLKQKIIDHKTSAATQILSDLIHNPKYSRALKGIHSETKKLTVEIKKNLKTLS